MTESVDLSDDDSFQMPKYIELENGPGRIILQENCVTYSSANFRDLDGYLINLHDHWHMVLVGPSGN